MPLWKVYHPVDAFTAEQKHELSEKITGLYKKIPIPEFYVVVLFHSVEGESFYVGGKSHDKFVRFEIDHIARALPGPILREFWVRLVEQTIAPYIKDRGFDWEVSIDETPFDLWALQGELPPPFESAAEKRWVAENRASPYAFEEKLPVNVVFAPGITGG